MRGRFPYVQLAKYPHLAGSDVAVWDLFLSISSGLFDSVDYDIHVGVGLPIVGDHSSAVEASWSSITQKRIDVVGYVQDAVALIEVKQRPDLRTLGQILGYMRLYHLAYPDHPEILPIVVAGIIEADTEEIFEHYGVFYFDLSDGHHNMPSALTDRILFADLVDKLTDQQFRITEGV